jgi:DNA-binding XRE family transcriptional regulator
MVAALSDKEIEQMRVHFRAWLRWLMEMQPEEFPTQAALAKAIGATGSSVTYWLRGERSPSLETALAVARLTDFTVDYMFKKLPPGSAASKR